MIERIFPASSGAPAEVSEEELLHLYGARPAGADRPWVSFNFVASIDGAATVDGRSGKLGNATDQHIFTLMRRHADVIVVGAATIRAEGYGGELLSAQAQQWRVDHGKTAHPQLAIVSGSLNLDPELEVFTHAPVEPLVVTTAGAPQESRSALSGVAQVINAGEDVLDVDLLVGELAARGLYNIHSEGGPTLLSTFQAADRVDELCLTVAPLLVGGSAPRIAHSHTHKDPHDGAGNPLSMQLAHLLKAESMLFLRYLRASKNP
ncbi:pyrimidine reductase family protein [Arthrobacter cryoconiti]|uniref:Pyrimidine reductase family protein n=1 Tax=Arthrobacter cryoconiti TaxID=748907 RepID=A0ABV8R004_9MICC|nr:pyrimidine reductase family protein [Arthrobacter cryoconiti]MCC9068418.1 pyrimidine reductase family protein [Arthrobacter cryoconiti]